MDDPLLGGLVERADGGCDGGRPVTLGAAERDVAGLQDQGLRLAAGALVDGAAAERLADALQGLRRACAFPGSSFSCHGQRSSVVRNGQTNAPYHTAPRVGSIAPGSVRLRTR